MEDKKAIIFNIQRFSIHDGPGIRTSVFYKGCPLRCRWCSNPESQNPQPELMWDNTLKKDVMAGKRKSVEEIMEVIRKDIDFYLESNGGVTVTGGEVLAQKDQVIKLLKQCKKEGIHTACETSAYASKEEFVDFISYVDLLIMDVKHYDTKKHKAKTGVALEPILRNLDAAIELNKEMLVRIPIIPKFNDSLKDAESFGQLLKKHQVKNIELLPFHQFGEEKYKYLNREYDYKDKGQIVTKDLKAYAQIIESFGVKCKVG